MAAVVAVAVAARHLQPAALRHELRVEALRRLLQRAHVVHHADLLAARLQIWGMNAGGEIWDVRLGFGA